MGTKSSFARLWRVNLTNSNQRDLDTKCQKVRQGAKGLRVSKKVSINNLTSGVKADKTKCPVKLSKSASGSRKLAVRQRAADESLKSKTNTQKGFEVTKGSRSGVVTNQNARNQGHVSVVTSGLCKL